MEDSLLAIVIYGCEVAGKRTESIDVQVRYFESGDIDAVESRIRSEPPHTYLNADGETVAWRIIRIGTIEHPNDLKDGAEIVGFITDCDQFSNWSREDVV